jgi:putative transposase
MSYWELYYHIVWGTKKREALIDDACEEAIRKSIWSTCERDGILVHAIGAMPDHLHLAVSIPPRSAIADIVRTLKTASTSFVKRTVRANSLDWFGWQHEYGVRSFDEDALDKVVSYVENQREHHHYNTLRPLFERLERPYPPQPSSGGAAR